MRVFLDATDNSHAVIGDEKGTSLLAFTDRNQCVLRQRLLAADEPIERVGIEENARQRALCRLRRSDLAGFPALYRL